jgi:hypothetical protein
MIYRKEYYLDSQEFFEVQYLDESLIVDEEIRKIINDKIENLKDMYNLKAKSMYKKCI